MKNKTYIIPPIEEHTQTIILLHGRDSTATEFATEFLESQSSDDRTLTESFPTTRWVFPTSRMRNSLRFETSMSQWFDMWSVENHLERNELQVDGLRESISEILDLVKMEAGLVSLERIILGGISQGCATAVHVLLRGGVRLGGFIGFSSWLPFEPGINVDDDHIWRRVGDRLCYCSEMFDIPAEAGIASVLSDLGSTSTTALDTPVFISHSRDDDIVPVANGKKLAAALEELGMMVSWREYEDGGHWVNEPQGVDDVVSFIRDVESRLTQN